MWTRKSISQFPSLWMCIATRVQAGPLFQRECLVGHLPPWQWRKIKGRVSRPTTGKFPVVQQSIWREPHNGQDHLQRAG